MFIIISVAIIFALATFYLKLLYANNIYEKIAIFYLIFSNFIILILISAVTNFDAILDIVAILFLLQFVSVMFLLFNRKKI